MKRSWKRAVLIVAILAFCFLLAFYLRFPDWFHAQPSREPPVSNQTFGDRLLVIAPHPDDETLGGAGAILKQLEHHKQVKVVIMTTGDGYRKAVREQFHIAAPKPSDFRKLGYVRHDESVHGLEALGVAPADMIFLGYPDGGVNGLWQNNWEYSHLHKALNGCTHAPYPFAYEKQAPYCGTNVVKNLTAIIREYQPTDILYPDPNDVHHDHWATQAFTKYTITQMQYHAKEWTYLVHRYDWPVPWAYEPNLGLQPPISLLQVGTRWFDLPLTQEEEGRKRTAIQQYRSQERVMEPFLEAFIRKNDLLGTYPPQQIPGVDTFPDFQKQEHVPRPLIIDPIGDTFTRKLHGAGDIRSLYVFKWQQKLWIVLQMRQEISADLSYFIRFRAFHSNQSTTRDDMKFLSNHLIEYSLADNSRLYARLENASMTIDDNRLMIGLPLTKDWGDVSNLMISADTYQGHTLIDKSAWENGRF
ncbi:PIG-L family deacetylase [Fodinisporobacter ferrooxydans]|uniref:PIG-L family deacetylase n=1 Tax=Fodinisporobacter ferrooxydans TaxID=2901836 RepID=A0ABY4CSR1_9BACL|nr:PIG-L family deacetylase [Alicyclobacillaceae bacterium MYW30-H2]